MKQLFIIAVTGALFCSQLNASRECCDSHVFVPRLISTDLTYANMQNFYERHNDERKSRFMYSGTFLYQSSNKSEELGSAFLLKNGCNCILVSNDEAKNPSVFSPWIGLGNGGDFEQTFCITPQRKVFAFHQYLAYDLSRLLKGLWIDASLVIARAEHELHCCQSGDGGCACNGDDDEENVINALCNPRLLYGKFNCVPRCADACHTDNAHTGIDDIQLRLGYDRAWSDGRYMAGIYLIGTIPTGDRVRNEYIFEPVVGSRHGSFGVGLQGHVKLWHNQDQSRMLDWMIDANYRYVFKAHHCRSFDLCCNGPFSRHLLVTDVEDPCVGMPAINFFTQSVEVSPRSTVQLWTALHYQHCKYDLEVGYNLFWRQSEEIGCVCDPSEEVGIFDYTSTSPSDCGTASTARICTGVNSIVRDDTFTRVRACDFNVTSARAASVLSNKFYVYAGMHGKCDDCMDWNAGLGGSYEFVTGNDKCAALPYWAVFGKFSLLF